MIFMLCFLSWIAVDAAAAAADDDDDDDDGDKDGDDDDNDVSTVYATDYSITNIYLSIYHPP